MNYTGAHKLIWSNTCIVFLNIPHDPNIIRDANISLSMNPLSPFIGTFILLDVDNLLVRHDFKIAPPVYG